MITNQDLIDRFFRYVKIDTQSKDETSVQPSTMKQHDLARLLVDELREMGVSDLYYDEEHCYVYAGLPGDDREPIGFISHMDTSPMISGANVKPRIIENYDGNDWLLKTDEFPELLNHIGEDLIATDGTTLLGADDKAGVSEIMNLVRFYAANPDVPHRPIRIAFTPDEEIGCGTLNFDCRKFGAKEGYTVDGSKLGYIQYECFNAAFAKVTIHGKSVHPGSAKNLMVNSVSVAMEFQSMMPKAEVPEHTEGYEGFYHLDEIAGNVEKTVMKYIIRDHDRTRFEERKAYVARVADYLNAKYGRGTVEAAISDTYYNMAEPMKEHMYLIENVKIALKTLGVEAKTEPIRGGTDGAQLSFRGIPCPNLCTGGYNFHGRFEYASIQEMEKTADMLIELVKI